MKFFLATTDQLLAESGREAHIGSAWNARALSEAFSLGPK